MGKASQQHQQILLADYPAPHLFAVVSWGCAATGWLARTLNSHPDIFAVHAANSIWSMLGDGERLAGVDYMRVLGVLGSAHAAAGDVHGVTAYEIDSLRKAYGSRFSCAVVVREPIARLKSALAIGARYESAYKEDLSFLHPLLDKIGLDPARLSYAELRTVNAINALNNITMEREVGPVFRSEDLTRDSRTLGELVRVLAPASVDETWAATAVQLGLINRHVRTPSVLEGWVTELLPRIIEPDTRRAYEALGYPPLP